MNLLKALKSFCHGLIATADSTNKPHIGIDRATPGCDCAVYSVSLNRWNNLVDDKMALKLKLEAATDALRQIQCLTNDKTDIYIMDRINSIAQNARRAATA